MLLCGAEAVKDSWISRAESVFSHCMSHPGVFAFLLDQWSQLLEAQQQQQAQPAAAAAGGSAGGPAVQPHVPAPMLDWMHEKVNVSREQLFQCGHGVCCTTVHPTAVKVLLLEGVI